MSDELNHLKILVSGAGAAGQAVAYWLARYGAKVTVIERAPAPRIGGFATDLRGSAVHVAEWMGIVDQMREVRVQLREIVRVDPYGKPLWKTDGNFGAGDGKTGDIEILRDDLTSLLGSALEQVDNNIDYVFSESIAGMTQDEAGVDVSFQSGRTARYDLVVGADGLHSNVRALTFGPEAQFARPFGQYVGIWTIPNLFDMDRQQYATSLPGKAVSIMQYGHDKHTRGMLLFSSQPLQYDRRDPNAAKQLIREAFKDDRDKWGVPELLDSLDAANDLYFDEVTQIHMPTWSKDRVVLIGDAAHAPTLMAGQGTSVAVVAAYVLAGELKAAAGDHRLAFPAYEAALRRYAELNQAIPTSAKELSIPQTWEEIHQRDQEVIAMLEGIGDTPATEREGDDSAAGKITEAANAIELHPY